MTSDKTTILLNVFSVDPKDAEAFKRQPGYISAQRHHGIGDGHMWFNYAVF